jgi:hypothetical protein
MLTRFFKSQRSQGLTEFALLTPFLFLVIFGIVDFGRVVYYYVTITQAANEGARVAIIGEPPDYLQSTNAQVLTAVTKHAIDASLGDPWAWCTSRSTRRRPRTRPALPTTHPGPNPRAKTPRHHPRGATR